MNERSSNMPRGIARPDHNRGLSRLMPASVCFSALLIAFTHGHAAAPEKKTPQTPIKCWTNREGIRECGNNVPPEYSQQGYERKDESGVTIGTQDRARSADDLQLDKEKVLRQQEEQRALEQQQAKDAVLLQTYASVDDLELARDGQIQNIDAQIRVAENHMARQQANFTAMIEAAANQERRGETPKPETIANIESVRGQIAGDAATIVARRKEKEVVTARYATDIERYRELKNLPPAQSSPVPTTATVPSNTSSASP